MSVLDSWLSPLGAEAFFRDVWTRAPWHAPSADRAHFSLDAFWEVLKRAPMTQAHVDAIRPTGRVDPNVLLGTGGVGVELGTVEALLEDGVTLRVRRADQWWPSLRELSLVLGEAFGCPVTINAYLSRGGEGVAPHYDHHHVFAVQVHGAKRWRLGPVVVRNPRLGVSLLPVMDPGFEREEETGAGEMLYLPPGLWHTVRTPQESLHLTVGVHPPTWADRLEDVLRRAVVAHPILRAHLPFAVEEGQCVYRDDVSEEILKLLSLLEREVGGDAAP